MPPEPTVSLSVLRLTESLLSLKKNRLLASLDAALTASAPNSSSVTDTSCSNGSNDGADQLVLDMDAEFASFQVQA